MKKFLSILAVIVLIISMLPMSVIAAEARKIEVAGLSEEFIYNDDGSYYSILVDDDGNIVPEEDDKQEVSTSGFDITPLEEESATVKATDIPTSWDSRDKGLVTSVKNQSPFGTCWSFSFCAAAESSLIAQGYETKDSVDLSEMHLVYFRDGNYVENSTIPVQKDKRVIPYDTFTYGGSHFDAITTVSRWSGFATEEKYSYQDAVSLYKKGGTNITYDTENMFEHEYELVSAKIIDPSNVEAVKKSIMTYGATEMTMYYNSAYEVRKDSINYYYCYDNLTSSTGAMLTNHAVTVVGWDDTISASNFKKTPAGDGAWLIKNSWGSTAWDDGYFWMSYYDTNIYDFTEVVAKPAGDYDNNYQYNGVMTNYGMQTSANTFTIANVFTANGTETVDACSFEIQKYAPYDCVVTVYGDVSNPDFLDEESTVGATATIHCEEEGFYTVKFDNPYQVTKGETFAVAVKYKKLGTNKIVVPVEPAEATSYLDAYHEAGQSYYYNGWNWEDTADSSYFGNFTIKAYTSDVITYNNDALTAEADSTLNINTSFKSISGISPGTKTLEGLVVKDGFYVEYTDIGSGKELKIYNKKNKLVDTYYFLIYGDINGDGWYDGQDAVFINSLYSGLLTKDQIGVIKWLAADCNHDGVIDETDYNIVINSGIYLADIDQTSTSSIDSASYEKYLSLIDQSEEPQVPDNDKDSEKSDAADNIEPEDTKTITFWQKISKFFQNIIKFFLGK